jgi:nucleoside-diphosphate-sugar epimerase
MEISNSVIVTGASTGIGRAVATHLHDLGGHPVLAARSALRRCTLLPTSSTGRSPFQPTSPTRRPPPDSWTPPSSDSAASTS